MRLQFSETMRGKTDDGAGFAFHVTAEAPTIGGLALSEMIRLNGEVELDGVADRVAAEGTLVIGLPWKPFLEYELAFSGRDGAMYRFAGKKTVKMLRFLETMTTLPGTIYRDGTPWKNATLRFDLGELGKLAGSVRVLPAPPPLTEVPATATGGPRTGTP